MELYQIEDLSFAYPGAQTPALSGIRLTVNQGEFVVLCGQSGCGKTTLLRLLKPAIAPAGTKGGIIRYGGVPLEGTEERTQAAEIGFVMQNPENQLVTHKVWHELAFGLESLGVSTPEIRARVSEMAAFFGMEDWFHQRVADLSGGQKQLLNLASVMVLQPKVLILDEPTGQLDPIAARDFFQTLSRIHRELGTTVILSEHRLEEAIPLADRVLVLDEGRLIADARPREIGSMVKDHPICHALPTPIRIHDALEEGTEAPLTIREGRLWLEDYASRHTLWQELIPKPEELPATKPILEIKDVRFRYQKEGEDVLRNFSVAIRQGEIYALLGGNGAGKSTALSLMAGLQTPQAGKVLFQGTPLSRIPDLHWGAVGLLPQDPKTLFVHKTVSLDLEDFPAGQNMTPEEREARIRQAAALCRMEHLLSRHPYDLSGGEQQRAALAKVLLQSPKLLLLDEPTKGMDAEFKIEFTRILRDLKTRGITVVMVSHDIEFCAEVADRCGLLFDGSITSEEVPRRFFAGKSFYTTAASRIARAVLPEAILPKDVILAFGGEVQAPPEPEHPLPDTLPKGEQEKTSVPFKKKKKPFRLFAGILLGILFVLTCVIFKQKSPEEDTVFLQLLSILELGGCLLCLFPRHPEKEPAPALEKREKLPKRTWLSAGFVLIAVPLTVYLGMTWLGDRKYYLVSLLILLETLLPFLLLWERRKSTARELVMVSVLCALAIAGRMAFSMLPQFKPVLAMVIIAGICLGGETGFLVGTVTAFVSNFFLGQGPWTPWQMLAAGAVGFLAGILFRQGLLPKTRGVVCVFGFLSTILIYGGILNPATVLLYQENPTGEMFWSAYLMGFPFDLIHAASTALFLWVLQKPMEEKLSRIKTKYGLTEEK